MDSGRGSNKMSNHYGRATNADFSQCLLCKHDTMDGACAAFPEGIPLVILTNEHDHRKAYDNDKGILFEPVTEHKEAV